MRRSPTVLVAVLLAALICVVPAQAKKKKGFKTGTYTAKLNFSSADGTFQNTTFKLKVYKGTCYKSKGGSLVKRRGYCISGKSSRPSVPLDCPDVADGPSDMEGYVFLPDQAWVSSKTGKFHSSNKNQTYGDDWELLTTSITLKRNGRATGYFEVTEQVSSKSVTSVCKSKRYSFTAKR